MIEKRTESWTIDYRKNPARGDRKKTKAKKEKKNLNYIKDLLENEYEKLLQDSRELSGLGKLGAFGFEKQSPSDNDDEDDESVEDRSGDFDFRKTRAGRRENSKQLNFGIINVVSNLGKNSRVNSNRQSSRNRDKENKIFGKDKSPLGKNPNSLGELLLLTSKLSELFYKNRKMLKK